MGFHARDVALAIEATQSNELEVVMDYLVTNPPSPAAAADPEPDTPPTPAPVAVAAGLAAVALRVGNHTTQERVG